MSAQHDPDRMASFYLGTHMPHWTRTLEVPLFVSHRRLKQYKQLPQARARWALDSGGFTELSMFGEWRTSEAEYATAVRRYDNEVGGMDWAAPMDWMCEPWILAQTGLSVQEHQRRTVLNYLRLKDRGLPVIPVLQGWQLDDYLRHVDDYNTAEINLPSEPVVGLGSVCRRQATREIAELIAALSSGGLRLHGFGIKGSGIRQYGWMLTSCDSMAWSYRGRHIKPCPHTGVGSCANCLPHALEWRQRTIRDMRRRPIQLALSGMAS